MIKHMEQISAFISIKFGENSKTALGNKCCLKIKKSTLTYPLYRPSPGLCLKLHFQPKTKFKE